MPAIARALATGASSQQARVELARAFCWAAVEAYWQHLPPARRSSDLPTAPEIAAAGLDKSATVLARDLGRGAAGRDVVEASYIIGRTYAAMLPDDMRSSLGVYYTPLALVERLLDQATAAGLDWRTCHVLDPACGGGAFLAPVARRMLRALGRCAPGVALRHLSERLAGFEIDPFAGWMTQVFVEATARVELRQHPGWRLPPIVRVCDSLEQQPAVDQRRFDLVIGNPPYGRVKLSAAVRGRYRRSLFGHANLYGVFTDLGLRYVRPGGLLCYVTPTSFLGGEYFKRLRELLLQEAPPWSIDFLARREGVFDDVLQETLLVTYRRGAAVDKVTVGLLHGGKGAGVTVESAGSIAVPASGPGAWIIPRSKAEAPLAQSLAGMPHRLADWGYVVSTGPLVWNRHREQRRHAKGAGCIPLIWAEAISPDGRFVFRAEKKNHTPYFKPGPGDEWLLVDEPCVLLQRTTAKEQQRRLIAAELPAAFLARHGHVTIENHVNMVRRSAGRPVVSLGTLTAFLNTAAADRVFRCISGSVAVSAFELEAMPLPAPELVERRLAPLVRRADRAAIERECANLYGLSS